MECLGLTLPNITFRWRTIAAAIGVGVVAVLAAHFLWTNERRVVETKLLPPDTPPAEYLYLDSDRVLAYLGQVEGGLTDKEKRLISEKESVSASLKGGLIADINGSAERQSSVEQTVTPAATDRFFTLLIKLRSGREQRGGQSFHWLQEVDARLDQSASRGQVKETLGRLHEGDFVRIGDARLNVPTYAALAPRTRYAARLQVRSTSAAPRALSALESDIKRYLRSLGADPVLPFVIRTTAAGRPLPGGATYFVPARYSALLDNARLLAGNLTVVGKVVYINPGRAVRFRCRERAGASSSLCYLDRETVVKFAPALQHAGVRLLESLGMRRRRILADVRRSVSFSPPLVVVLPVAIYQ